MAAMMGENVRENYPESRWIWCSTAALMSESPGRDEINWCWKKKTQRM